MNLKPTIFLLASMCLLLLFSCGENRRCKEVTCTETSWIINQAAETCCFHTIAVTSSFRVEQGVDFSFDLNDDGTADITFHGEFSDVASQTRKNIWVYPLNETAWAMAADSSLKQFSAGEPLVPDNETWINQDYLLTENESTFDGVDYTYTMNNNWEPNGETRAFAVRILGEGDSGVYGWVFLSVDLAEGQATIKYLCGEK